MKNMGTVIVSAIAILGFYIALALAAPSMNVQFDYKKAVLMCIVMILVFSGSLLLYGKTSEKKKNNLIESVLLVLWGIGAGLSMFASMLLLDFEDLPKTSTIIVIIIVLFAGLGVLRLLYKTRSKKFVD